MGSTYSSEFGLLEDGKNYKIEVKTEEHLNLIAKIIIDDRCYDSRTESYDLAHTKFTFFHEPRGWIIDLGFK